MSTLGAQLISHLSLHMPRFGAWRADVVLANGELPNGAVTLTVGDLALKGTVLRASFDAPGKPHAVVTGAPGWERAVVRPLSYESDAGVRLSSVLKDLAARAAEPIEQPADKSIGHYFAAPASSPIDIVRLRHVLMALYRTGVVGLWRVDPDGVTRFGKRVGAEVSVRATVLRPSGSDGSTVYGLDAPAAFLPGNTIDAATIERVLLEETANKLEAKVWTS